MLPADSTRGDCPHCGGELIDMTTCADIRQQFVCDNCGSRGAGSSTLQVPKATPAAFSPAELGLSPRAFGPGVFFSAGWACALFCMPAASPGPNRYFNGGSDETFL